MQELKEFDPDTEAGQKDIQEEYNKHFEAPRYQKAPAESVINRNWLIIVIISFIIVFIFYYIIKLKTSRNPTH